MDGDKSRENFSRPHEKPWLGLSIWLQRIMEGMDEVSCPPIQPSRALTVMGGPGVWLQGIMEARGYLWTMCPAPL